MTDTTPAPDTIPVVLFGGPFDGAPAKLEPKDLDVHGGLPHDLATAAHWGHDYYLTSVDTRCAPPIPTYTYRYPRSGIRHVCQQPGGCGPCCPDSPARRARVTESTTPCPRCARPTIVTQLRNAYRTSAESGIAVRIDAAPSARGTLKFYGSYAVPLTPPDAQVERDAGARLYAVHSVTCRGLVSGDA